MDKPSREALICMCSLQHVSLHVDSACVVALVFEMDDGWTLFANHVWLFQRGQIWRPARLPQLSSGFFWKSSALEIAFD